MMRDALTALTSLSVKTNISTIKMKLEFEINIPLFAVYINTFTYF